ncbi:MAG TPA: hypothetical protein VF002_09790 [Gaiellaceae bacterium]
MGIVRYCRAAFVVPVFGLLLLLVPAQAPPAADGTGRVVITPTHVAAASSDTYTLVFLADTGSLQGQTLLDIPPGWSLPQTTSPGAAGYVSLAPGTCSTATRILRLVGRRLVISTSCARGQSFTLTYGPALAPTIAADGFVFLTETKPATGVVTSKLVKRVVKSKRGKRKTTLRRIRLVTKPAFRPLAPQKQPVVVVSGAVVDHLVVSAPSIVTSATPFEISVRAEDVYGNAACCYTGTVSFSSSDPNAFVPTPSRFSKADGGLKSFGNVILRTTGTQTISVRDDSGHLATSNPINVYPYPTG